MWIRGHVGGVGFWYVLWSPSEEADEGCPHSIEIYKTFNGLAGWFRDEDCHIHLPVERVGRVLVTKEGFTNQEHYETREEFLKYARPLVPFILPGK